MIKWVYLRYRGGDTNVGGGTDKLHAFSGDGAGTELATLVAPPGAVQTGYGWVSAEITHTVANSLYSYAVSYLSEEDIFGEQQAVCYVRIGYSAPHPNAVSLTEMDAQTASLLPADLHDSLTVLLVALALGVILWRRKSTAGIAR